MKKKVINLMSLIDSERSKNYDDLVKIGIIFNSELNEESRSLFHFFSKCSDTKYYVDECNKKYDSFKTEKGNKLTIGTLQMLAKEDSPDKYEQLYKNKDGTIKSTFTLLEQDISDYIRKFMLNDTFLCIHIEPDQFLYF